MALYQPRNLQPYLQCIDGSRENIFSCQINGDECIGYEVYLNAINGGYGSYNWAGTLEQPLYNGEVLQFPVHLPWFLTNGNDYSWSIKLKQKDKTMKVAQGIVGGSLSKVITITAPTTDAEKEKLSTQMKYVEINGKTVHEVESYDDLLNQIHLVKGVYLYSNVADGVTIKAYNNEQQETLLYTGKVINNTTTKICLNPPGWSEGYKIKIKRQGGDVFTFDEDQFTVVSPYIIELKEPLPSALIYGDMYEMYSDFIISNPETPFYIRSNPILNIQDFGNAYEVAVDAGFFVGSGIDWHNYAFDYSKFSSLIGDKLGNYIISYSREDGILSVRNVTTGDGWAWLQESMDCKEVLRNLGFDFTWEEELLPSSSLAIIRVENQSETYHGIYSKEYTFIGQYSQAENVSIKSHKWKLWIYNSNEELSLLQETDDIHSVNLVYTYNAFRPGYNYAIQLEIEDTYGRHFDTGIIKLRVDYEVPLEIEIRPEAKLDCKKTAIELVWGDICTFDATLDSHKTITVYSNNTYTHSDKPNRVYEMGGDGQPISTTVDPTAYVIDTIPYGAVANVGESSLSIDNDVSITYEDWRKEDRTGVVTYGVMDTTENFCVTWNQKFNSNYQGGRVYSNTPIITNKIPQQVEITDINVEYFLHYAKLTEPEYKYGFYVIGYSDGRFWIGTNLQPDLNGANRTFDALSTMGITANMLTDNLTEGVIATVDFPLEDKKIIMSFERLDEEGISHKYTVWLTSETNLESKYKFVYDLDGIEGSYIWDSRKQNFCLQNIQNVSLAEDYIFTEILDETEQMWQDSNYFLENGTRDDVLNKYWWKFIMTKDELIIKKGSVI